LAGAAAFGLPLIAISLYVREFEPGKLFRAIGSAFTGLFRHFQPGSAATYRKAGSPAPGFVAVQ
jgi:hypothetical protein